MATSSGFRIGIVVVLVILSITILAALLLYRSGVVSFPDGVNILADGSFEDGTGPGGVFKPNQDGVMSFPTSDGAAIPGWTVSVAPHSRQDVAWVDNANRFVPKAATDGSHFLDLTGLNDTPLPDGSFGAVSQTFGTTVNKRYHLSFDIMVAPPSFGGPITVDALIKRSPNEAPYAQTTCGPFNPTTPGNQAKTCGLDFTATTPSTTLTIVGTAAAHNYIGLDRVSVECVAPLGRQGFCS
jgi:hypothetical protein